MSPSWMTPLHHSWRVLSCLHSEKGGLGMKEKAVFFEKALNEYLLCPRHPRHWGL